MQSKYYTYSKKLVFSGFQFVSFLKRIFLMQMRSGFRNSKRKLYQRDLLIFADIFVYSTGQNQDFFSYFFTECATAI